ncbi:7SK snRNA methylphosphate capping enzyme [Lissotriton helveticus]
MQTMIDTPNEKKSRGGASPAGGPAPACMAPPPRTKDTDFNRPRNGFQPPKPGGAPPGGGKRRNSFHVGGFKHPGGPFGKRRRRANSDCDPVLPSNFLLGGNIFDPLNLNSLLDEEVSRALNAETPRSSPLPRRGRDPVQILVPRDITDPLSLNLGTDGEVLVSPLKSGGGRKRHRHRHHPAAPAEGAESPPAQPAHPAQPARPAEPLPYELNTAINCRDEVVAPASLRHRKRKQTGSRGSAEPARRASPPRGPQPAAAAPRPARRKFQYGNYCKYYGYRNPGRAEDPRLRLFQPAWFQGKEVLDLGCNVGHVSLSLARGWGAARVVGLDIDGRLVHAARQNVRHYLSELQQEHSRAFPASLAAIRGPIAAPQLPPPPGGPAQGFPQNLLFVTGNYVLERDELLEAQSPEYDVILCLSVTKWVHLNWGDEGLKRMFKRIYRHLRPGGLLLLEPQAWSSYGKRKNLTEAIYKNYNRIQFKPEQFTSYLVSQEVGFARYELVGTPQSTTKGFQRPIYLFHKSHSSFK